jgi:hypothetical protein
VDLSVVASGLVSSTFNSLLHRGHFTWAGSSIGSSSLLSDGHLLSKCASSISACTSVSSLAARWALEVINLQRLHNKASRNKSMSDHNYSARKCFCSKLSLKSLYNLSACLKLKHILSNDLYMIYSIIFIDCQAAKQEYGLRAYGGLSLM